MTRLSALFKEALQIFCRSALFKEALLIIIPISSAIFEEAPQIIPISSALFKEALLIIIPISSAIFEEAPQIVPELLPNGNLHGNAQCLSVGVNRTKLYRKSSSDLWRCTVSFGGGQPYKTLLQAVDEWA